MKPGFTGTDLFGCLPAPRCPPFLVLAVVQKEPFALVLQRGAQTAALVLPLFGAGGLDRGQGPLQRM